MRSVLQPLIAFFESYIIKEYLNESEFIHEKKQQHKQLYVFCECILAISWRLSSCFFKTTTNIMIHVEFGTASNDLYMSNDTVYV